MTKSWRSDTGVYSGYEPGQGGAPSPHTLPGVLRVCRRLCRAAALLPYLLLELVEFLLQRLFLFTQPGRYHQHVGSWCRGRTQDIILYRHHSKCTRRPTSVHPVFTPTSRPAYSSLWPCPNPLSPRGRCPTSCPRFRHQSLGVPQPEEGKALPATPRRWLPTPMPNGVRSANLGVRWAEKAAGPAQSYLTDQGRRKKNRGPRGEGAKDVRRSPHLRGRRPGPRSPAPPRGLLRAGSRR